MRSNPFLKFLIIAVSLTMLVSLTAVYFMQQIIEQEKIQTLHRYSNDVTLISNGISNRLDAAIKVLEVTAQRPVVRNTDYAHLIDEAIKGIPMDADLPKRQTAKDILRSYNDFEFITFHMPNGDFYLMEPYEDQINVTRLNFADRDWYTGVMQTNRTYVSEVYESTTLKKDIVAIRTPVFDSDGNLIGIWGNSMDLSFLHDVAGSYKHGKNLHIIFYDQYGNVISDTTEEGIEPYDGLMPFVELALEGKSETTIVSEREKLFLAYSPIRAGQSNWAIVVFQPYEDAFPMESSALYAVTLMILTFTAIIGCASYFIYSSMKSNIRLNERLRQADVQKEEFSAMVTHELKTPLVPIIGYCKMLKNSMLGAMNDEQQSAINTIEKNTKQMEQLISDIMDARKLDLGKMKFNLADTSVKEFLENLESSYREVLAKQEKIFTVESIPIDLVIKTDGVRLRQVFDNLISNAIKFTPAKDGKITIGCKKEGDSVLFYVKDNGIGIPPSAQSHLFKRFYQIDTSERRKTGGTGLGLAICKGIIESMEGIIWVESDGKTGTTFYIKFHK